MGVTIYADGPDLANQGTVVAANVPVEPHHYVPVSVANTNPATRSFATMPGIKFQAGDVPSYDNLIRMPNAYFGQSKAGVYMPLKLSTNHMQWHSSADMKNDVSANTDTGVNFLTEQQVIGGGPAPPSNYPYYGSGAAYLDPNNGMYFTATRFMPCNENWGHCCFTNMSIATSLTLVFRVGYEVQCQPTSSFASFLKLSPPYDPQAIADYYAISRELKDAYPADYNDLGKLWGVIKNAAKTALPFVRQFGGPIGGAIAGVGDLLLNGSEEPRDKLPAATVERAQKMIDASEVPRTPRAARKPRPKPRSKVPVTRRR